MKHSSLARPIAIVAIVAVGAAALLARVSALAREPWRDAGGRVEAASSYTVPPVGRIEIAFSPNEGAEALVLRVIRSAAHPGGQLRMLAYSFTSAAITREILGAKRAGADVHLVVDARECGEHDRTGKAARNLAQLVGGDVDVRTLDTYLDAHDKVVIADERTVETGSYNDSDASARANSENVVVLWDNPKAAAAFLTHFQRNYLQAAPFRPPH